MAPAVAPKISPAFGFWRSWALVVGTIIGSGIFLMPTVLSQYGGLGLISVAAAGLGGVCIALTFSSLAQRVSGSGGPYAFTRAGFGDLAGFLIAWMYWASLWAGGAALATALPGYLGALLPAVTGSRPWSLAIALIAVWTSVGINWLGAKEAGIVGLLTTLMKLVPLLVIATAGLFLIDRATLPPLNPSPSSPFYALAAAFSIAFYSYTGIEAATIPADQVIDAKRTIPRATVVGTLTVVLVYLLVTLVVMGVVPAATLSTSQSPLSIVGARLAGPWGAASVSIGALVSIYACLHYNIFWADRCRWRRPATACSRNLSSV